MNFETQLLHNGNEVDPVTGAVGIPLYQSSTFHQNVDRPGNLITPVREIPQEKRWRTPLPTWKAVNGDLPFPPGWLPSPRCCCSSRAGII